eukprot:284816739_2
MTLNCLWKPQVARLECLVPKDAYCTIWRIEELSEAYQPGRLHQVSKGVRRRGRGHIRRHVYTRITSPRQPSISSRDNQRHPSTTMGERPECLAYFSYQLCKQPPVQWPTRQRWLSPLRQLAVSCLLGLVEFKGSVCKWQSSRRRHPSRKTFGGGNRNRELQRNILFAEWSQRSRASIRDSNTNTRWAFHRGEHQATRDESEGRRKNRGTCIGRHRRISGGSEFMLARHTYAGSCRSTRRRRHAGSNVPVLAELARVSDDFFLRCSRQKPLRASGDLPREIGCPRRSTYQALSSVTPYGSPGYQYTHCRRHRRSFCSICGRAQGGSSGGFCESNTSWAVWFGSGESMQSGPQGNDDSYVAPDSSLKTWDTERSLINAADTSPICSEVGSRRFGTRGGRCCGRPPTAMLPALCRDCDKCNHVPHSSYIPVSSAAYGVLREANSPRRFGLQCAGSLGGIPVRAVLLLEMLDLRRRPESIVAGWHQERDSKIEAGVVLFFFNHVSSQVLSIGDDEPERRAAAYVRQEMPDIVRGLKVVKMISHPDIIQLSVQLEYIIANLRELIKRTKPFDIQLQVHEKLLAVDNTLCEETATDFMQTAIDFIRARNEGLVADDEWAARAAQFVSEVPQLLPLEPPSPFEAALIQFELKFEHFYNLFSRFLTKDGLSAAFADLGLEVITDEPRVADAAAADEASPLPKDAEAEGPASAAPLAESAELFCPPALKHFLLQRLHSIALTHSEELICLRKDCESFIQQIHSELSYLAGADVIEGKSQCGQTCSQKLKPCMLMTPFRAAASCLTLLTSYWAWYTTWYGFCSFTPQCSSNSPSKVTKLPLWHESFWKCWIRRLFRIPHSEMRQGWLKECKKTRRHVLKLKDWKSRPYHQRLLLWTRRLLLSLAINCFFRWLIRSWKPLRQCEKWEGGTPSEHAYSTFVFFLRSSYARSRFLIVDPWTSHMLNIIFFLIALCSNFSKFNCLFICSQRQTSRCGIFIRANRQFSGRFTSAFAERPPHILQCERAHVRSTSQDTNTPPRIFLRRYNKRFLALRLTSRGAACSADFAPQRRPHSHCL